MHVPRASIATFVILSFLTIRQARAAEEVTAPDTPEEIIVEFKRGDAVFSCKAAVPLSEELAKHYRSIAPELPGAKNVYWMYAITLGAGFPLDRDRLAEQHRLAQPVLAGGGVDRQERLVRRAGRLALDHLAHLAELVHQVLLRVEPAGCVDDHHIVAARLAGVLARTRLYQAERKAREESEAKERFEREERERREKMAQEKKKQLESVRLAVPCPLPFGSAVATQSRIWYCARSQRGESGAPSAA